MYKGFYNLTSAVLTHQRNLDVIANNMTNVSTPGFKQERYIATTFDEVMYNRVGNKDGEGSPIGKQSYIRATDDVTIDFTQGAPERTDYPLDFCINGQGFFGVETLEGGRVYTRGGNFSLNDDGYLCLPGMGYVLNPQGQRIQLGTDKIYSDSDGTLRTQSGEALNQIGVFSFDENTAIERSQEGVFLAAGQPSSSYGKVMGGYVERSNTDPIKQMTEMMTYQRSLQSAAQIMKLYDGIMGKASTEIGKL